MTAKNGGRPARSWVFPLTLTAAGAILLAGPSDAGTVFMKNGYIIQGPIVEHCEDWVMLGWSNGKVTIFRRFVEKLDFEPGEERNIVRAPEVIAQPFGEEPVVTQGVEEELPQSLSELVKIYNLPTAFVAERPPPVDGLDPGKGPEGTGSDPGSTTPEVTDPSAAGGGTGTTDPTAGAGAVQPPWEGTLADRVGDPRWGFSIQPPAAWRLAEVEGCVSWTGRRSPEGFSPSLNVTSSPRGSLKWDEACRALREDQKTPLGTYEMIVEEPLAVAGRSAFRVAGRGTASKGTTGGERRVMVHQVMVEEGERLWLISTFLDPSLPEEVGMLLDRSMHTIRFGG